MRGDLSLPAISSRNPSQSPDVCALFPLQKPLSPSEEGKDPAAETLQDKRRHAGTRHRQPATRTGEQSEEDLLLLGLRAYGQRARDSRSLLLPLRCSRSRARSQSPAQSWAQSRPPEEADISGADHVPGHVCAHTPLEGMLGDGSQTGVPSATRHPGPGPLFLGASPRWAWSQSGPTLS